MPNVFSPQVVTREVDVSTVAPSVSSSIAAIVGGAVKGPVNDPQFITTPDQFVEVYGEPTPLSFLGYTAINFLRQGNQLWVNRVASLSGSDPVQLANTDTTASIVGTDVTTFSFTGTLELLIDGVTEIINFSPATSATVNDIANTITVTLEQKEPRLAFATVVDGTKIAITTQSQDSRISNIAVVTAPSGLGFTVGQQASSSRTILTAEALTPAALTSINSNTTLNTTVAYAKITGAIATYNIGETYNLSALAQESYLDFSVLSNIFDVGSYNTGTITVDTLPANTNTLTVGTLVLTFVSGAPANTAQIQIDGGATVDSVAAAIATAINTHVAWTANIPTAAARASAANNVITVTQIDADITTVVPLSKSAPNISISGATLTGGVQGSYIKVTVPSGYTGTSSEATGVTDVDYYFQAGADFDAGGAETITGVAQNLATAIDGFGGYFSGTYTYALTAVNSSSQVTISSALDGESTGNLIKVDFSTSKAGALSESGAAVLFAHGFDARTYSFGSIVVDGITKVIDFDTVSVAIMPTKHEATLAQVVSVINSEFGDIVASAQNNGTFEWLQVASTTPGAEGTVTGTISTTTGTLKDPLDIIPIVTAGSGDNHFSFKVDDQYEVDVYFTQSASLSLADAAIEINDVASAISVDLSNVATVDTNTNKLVLTSPTGGSFADFGSRMEITNTLVTVDEAVWNIAVNEGNGNNLNTITATAITEGSWANAVISVAFQDEDPLFSAPNSSRLDVLYNNIVVESFREVVVNPTANGITGVAGDGIFIENAVNGTSQFINIDFDDDLLDLDPDTLASSVKIVQNTSILGSLPPYVLSGGNDGLNGLSSGDVIGTIDSLGNESGLQVFADTEKVFINLLAAPGFTAQAVGNELVSIAEAREDTLALIDPPTGLSASDMVDWHNGLGNGRTAALNTSYAATYNTWITQYDPYNDTNIDVPPSAHMLAQFAYSDSVSEPWFATAGLTRGRLTSALDILSPTSIGDRELLYGQGNRVNPIPKFIQEGVVAWGNRTLYRQESALKEITVRRLLNYAKVIIGLAAKVIIFEPSDPTTVKRLLELINPVLYSIRTRRGLTDFKVVDATSDRDRNLNRLVVRIFLQPTRTVEVIDIPFVITAQGGSFSL